MDVCGDLKAYRIIAYKNHDSYVDRFTVPTPILKGDRTFMNTSRAFNSLSRLIRPNFTRGHNVLHNRESITLNNLI